MLLALLLLLLVLWLLLLPLVLLPVLTKRGHLRMLSANSAVTPGVCWSVWWV